MKRIKSWLELTFYLVIIIYSLILLTQLPAQRPIARIFPLIMILISVIFSSLKIAFILTKSRYIQIIESIRYVDYGKFTEKEESEIKTEVKPKSEFFAIFSLILYLLSIYIFGFYPSTALFIPTFAYISSKKVKVAICVGIINLFILYLFSTVFPLMVWGGILFE
ncbi:MAG: tripartite tricarboxylate transporter TctB family protein [Nitrososphaerales archaeon]